MNEDLPNGHDKRRAVNVIPFHFNVDGSISKLSHSNEGITKSLKNLNPFQRTEAETMAWEVGIETAKDNVAGVYVTDISNNDYIKVRSVDFGNGANQFSANVAAGATGGSIEIHLDAIDGPLAGICKIKVTGGGKQWKNFSTKIKNTKGVHDIYFVFKGKNEQLFNFNYWVFNK